MIQSIIHTIKISNGIINKCMVISEKKCVKSGRMKWFVTILYSFLSERHICTH